MNALGTDFNNFFLVPRNTNRPIDVFTHCSDVLNNIAAAVELRQHEYGHFSKKGTDRFQHLSCQSGWDCVCEAPTSGDLTFKSSRLAPVGTKSGPDPKIFWDRQNSACQFLTCPNNFGLDSPQNVGTGRQPASAHF